MRFSEISKQLIGRKFGFDDSSLNCFTLIVEYLRLRGAMIPYGLNYEGYTFNNYAEKYKQDKSCFSYAVKYIATLTKQIPPKRSVAGDILYIDNDGLKSMAIDSGNGNMMGVNPQHGVMILRKNNYEILRAFRWE